ncbi:MAG: hypothetical protein PQJ50_11370 [Spirochaetales bacterium]|nr:hypothetical protein [Spirochaetales bacterium]
MKNFIYITIDGEELVFYRQSEKENRETGRVRIEWDYLLKVFIRNPIPTEAEIEYSINYIEDELMKDLNLVNSDNLELFCREKELIELLGSPGKETVHSKQEIEELFTPYALLSMGRSPIYDDLAMDSRKYMTLLVVREILNHLKFDSIHLPG